MQPTRRFAFLSFAILITSVLLLFQNCGELKPTSIGPNGEFSSTDPNQPASDENNDDGPRLDPDGNPLPTGIQAIDGGSVERPDLVVELRASNPDSDDIEISWETVDGTAVAGTNYQAFSGTATIPSGELSASIRIPLIQSGVADLTFEVRIVSISKGVIEKASATVVIPANFGLQNLWAPMNVVGAPSPRIYAATAWTGSKWIVWGGFGPNTVGLNDGAIYDPANDTWTPMSTVNAPSARVARAVWTGSVFIVWGGRDNTNRDQRVFGDGAMYDPANDTWTPMSMVNAPSARDIRSLVWTGSRMIVWGGPTGYIPEFTVANDGAMFDPVNNTWTPMNNVGAPSPRSLVARHWLGDKLFVWGGYLPDGNIYYSDGALYDPANDSWQAVSNIGAPGPRRFGDLQGVTSGSKVILWSGELVNSQIATDGSVYDAENDSWSSINPVGAPTADTDNMGSIWTGIEAIFWGHTDMANGAGLGYIYRPDSNTWQAMTQVNSPPGRRRHNMVWTGSEMLVYGGMPAGGVFDNSIRFGDGGRYR